VQRVEELRRRFGPGIGETQELDDHLALADAATKAGIEFDLILLAVSDLELPARVVEQRTRATQDADEVVTYTVYVHPDNLRSWLRSRASEADENGMKLNQYLRGRYLASPPESE